MRCSAIASWGLIAVDEFQLNGSLISREYGELSSSEGDRFFDIFLGHLHRKWLLSVKIEKVQIEKEVLILDTLEFDTDLVEFQFLILY